MKSEIKKREAFERVLEKVKNMSGEELQERIAKSKRIGVDQLIFLTSGQGGKKLGGENG